MNIEAFKSLLPFMDSFRTFLCVDLKENLSVVSSS